MANTLVQVDNRTIDQMESVVKNTQGYSIVHKTDQSLLYVGVGQPWLFLAERVGSKTNHYRIPLELLL